MISISSQKEHRLMTLADLVEQAFSEQWFSSSRYRPMKSAAGHYAQLLGYKSPNTCPVEAAIRPLPTIQALIEAHAKPGLLPESIANQWRSIWNLITEAVAHGVIPVLPQSDEHEWRTRGNMHQASRVHQHRWDGLALGRYGLSDWPIELAHDTYNYVAWCQKPLARGRPARIQKAVRCRAEPMAHHGWRTRGRPGHIRRPPGADGQRTSHREAFRQVSRSGATRLYCGTTE
jgi:hypothetical protein